VLHTQLALRDSEHLWQYGAELARGNHCSRHPSIWSISRCCEVMMSSAIFFRSGCINPRSFAASAISIASRWCGTMASMKARSNGTWPRRDRRPITCRLGALVAAAAAGGCERDSRE
jgi:hypothetical protein